MEIIIGLALMSGLFFVVAYLFSKGNPILGPMAFLTFCGFGVITMNLLAASIYTEWNNTAIYNSSGMELPGVLMTVSVWSVWIWVLLVVLGVLLAIFTHLTNPMGGRK